ncbi:MAG: HAMP domain-containing protein [Anaerolineales bacterium]|nr:HAMP domain-containing protein [Chloroflexota bacterium]MBL6980192.1 HAMP domain-containing protein [Anaerolineales bacterium]
MSITKTKVINRSRTLNYVLGIVFILLITVILIELVMSPPPGDLIYLALYLGLTSLGSAVFGFASHRLGWWKRLPRISYALILGYILAGGLTLFNVWITARLMFINQHDLALATLLLFFAGGISISFGYFISNTISQTLETLAQGAQQLSQGDFSTRVPVYGENEIAQLSAAFNEMATKLEQASENERALDEARRNLVAWASHDLRTPLTSLRVMIDALADGVVDDPKTVSRYLRQSQNEIVRMTNLLNDLFELAQLDAGYQELNFEWINLSDLISDTLESFAARAAAQSVTLEGFVDPQVDPVWAAPDKLSRILDNLFNNAFRHTSIEDTVQLSASKQDQNTIVIVKDTGSGILEKDLPFIFDRFYRGEKSRARENDDIGGVGLGLTIVKGLVEAHGGEIQVMSKTGEGTTFRFSLPGKSPD